MWKHSPLLRTFFLWISLYWSLNHSVHNLAITRF
jgi:hypothetical protein